MGRQGIDLRMTAQVETLRREGDGLVAMPRAASRSRPTPCCWPPAAKPNTAGMGLDAAGVKLTRAVPWWSMRSTAAACPRCWPSATSSRLALTPVALAEAMVVVDQLFGDGQRRMGYDNVPTAVFTHPNVATCGLTEVAAREVRREGRAHLRSRLQALRHTLSGRDERTFIKLVVDAKSDCVVRAHGGAPTRARSCRASPWP